MDKRYIQRTLCRQLSKVCIRKHNIIRGILFSAVYAVPHIKGHCIKTLSDRMINDTNYSAFLSKSFLLESLSPIRVLQGCQKYLEFVIIESGWRLVKQVVKCHKICCPQQDVDYAWLGQSIIGNFNKSAIFLAALSRSSSDHVIPPVRPSVRSSVPFFL